MDMADTRTDPGVSPFRSDASTPRLVGAVWALLLVNTLAYTDVATIVPLPRRVAQVITMGSLVGALGLALVLNPRVRVRPNLYLLLLSLLVIVSIASSLRLESGLGALFRCFRLVVFVATLWLLSGWWRGELTFVRHHIRSLAAVLLLVLVGLVASPGAALSAQNDGRLTGTLWPIPPPQVGQYGAVVAGLTIVLWLTRSIDGRSVAWIVPPAIVTLLLSHTRTATIGLVVAVAGVGLTLTLSNARARRALVVVAGFGGLVAVTAGSVVQAWLTRGQDAATLGTLTGRQTVWDHLLAQDRSLGQRMLGVGLTDKSFNGLSIDSSWLATYNDQGFVGVAIVAAMLVGLLVAAALRPPSPARACAVFLILYCVSASYTESGLGDASPYLLHLAVAASLLSPGAPAAAVSALSARAPG
ncbi:MAG: O-antigen ligase domain-containing protein [Pseudonocardiaceae bacterium]